jgi:hypothetical protein
MPHGFDYLSTFKTDEDGEKRPMLSGLLQSNLLYWIMRRTFGHPENPEWVSCSVRDLAEMTGADPKNVADALQDLIDRRIIKSRGQKKDDLIRVKGQMPKCQYRLTPENWRDARPYRMTPRQSSAEQIAPEVRSANVKPRSHQDVTVPIRHTGTADPIPLRVIYRSELDHAVTFKAESIAPGTLRVTTFDAAKKTHVLVQVPTRSTENKTVSELEAMIRDTCLDFLVSMPPPLMLAKVGSALAGAPLDIFELQCRSKFSADRRKKWRPGILINLASDAARTWKARTESEAEIERRARRRGEEQATMARNDAQTVQKPLDPSKAWDRIRQRLKQRMPAESYANWFVQTRQLAEDPESITVLLENSAAKILMTEDYAELLTEVSAEVKAPRIVWRVAE